MASKSINPLNSLSFFLLLLLFLQEREVSSLIPDHFSSSSIVKTSLFCEAPFLLLPQLYKTDPTMVSVVSRRFGNIGVRIIVFLDIIKSCIVKLFQKYIIIFWLLIVCSSTQFRLEDEHSVVFDY